MYEDEVKDNNPPQLQGLWVCHSEYGVGLGEIAGFSPLTRACSFLAAGGYLHFSHIHTM